MLELPLVDIVLVLAHSNGLRIYFHKLRERVLQPPRNGNGAAYGQIQVGKLLPRYVGSRVDARAGLRNHHFENTGKMMLGQEVANEGIGLPRGSTVADRDGAHIVLTHQPRERLRSLRALSRMRIDHVVRQKLASLINNSNLAPGTQTRVQPKHRNRSCGRSQQQIL